MNSDIKGRFIITLSYVHVLEVFTFMWVGVSERSDMSRYEASKDRIYVMHSVTQGGFD